MSSLAVTESSNGSSSGVDMVIDPVTKRRVTRSIDIFSLGCVFYFVLSSGDHPFGDRMSREINILHQHYNIDRLDTLADAGVEAKDLIASMINGDPKLRPDTAKVGAHPFFWPQDKRLEFLCAVSDRFESEENKEKTDLKNRVPNPYISPLIPILERDATSVVGPKGWMTRLDKSLRAELDLNKRRGYDPMRVLHLLRMMRNKRNHFEDMIEEAQKKLGGGRDEEFYEYFAGRFEGLLLYAWKVVQEVGWADGGDKKFAKFFRHPFTV